MTDWNTPIDRQPIVGPRTRPSIASLIFQPAMARGLALAVLVVAVFWMGMVAG